MLYNRKKLLKSSLTFLINGKTLARVKNSAAFSFFHPAEILYANAAFLINNKDLE